MVPTMLSMNPTVNRSLSNRRKSNNNKKKEKRKKKEGINSYLKRIKGSILKCKTSKMHLLLSIMTNK